MTKPLSQLADELGQLLEDRRNKMFDAMYSFTKVCPTCKELITDRNSLYNLAEEGECSSCSHVRGEGLEGYASQKDYEESQL